MDNQESLTRAQSMPTLKSEEAVLSKLSHQDGLISLLQTQIDFQNEVIGKHDKTITELLGKVEELTEKVQTLDELFTKHSEGKEQDAARSVLWTEPGKDDKKTSIADMVKETAEQTLGTELESGFQFDEKLGLYFDQNSGYYYDPVKQLYYNGHTKTFYSYDAATSTYKEYSPPDTSKRKKKNSQKKRVKQKITPENCGTERSHTKEESSCQVQSDTPVEGSIVKSGTVQNPSDMEEGEISSSPPTSAVSSPRSCSNEESGLDESSNDSGLLTSSYPPCIRAVIQESDDTKEFKKGTLFVIPYTGGTIGSSGSHHAILLNSPTIEKNHAKVHFEKLDDSEGSLQSGKYFVTDLGSTQGTFLNKQRLSNSGDLSEPCELVHGSTLQCGSVTLLVHIHPGDLTCGHCEPGLVLEKVPMYEYTGGSTGARSEIKKLKVKYGLDRRHAGIPTTKSEAKYTDRASSRRAEVGSDNPFAKTEVASANTPMKSSSKGFKMLQKMGWKGEGLGKEGSTGIKEPIKCQVKSDRLGLGAEEAGLVPTTSSENGKQTSSRKRLERLAKTIDRFNEAKTLDETNDLQDQDLHS